LFTVESYPGLKLAANVLVAARRLPHTHKMPKTSKTT
jgi:hypothetical protein